MGYGSYGSYGRFPRENAGFPVLACLGIAVLVGVAEAAVVAVAMFLWTYAVPVIWSERPVATWWQVIVAIVLLSFLGMFFRGSSSSRSRD